MTANVSWEIAVTAEHVTNDMASIALCRSGEGRGLNAGTGDILGRGDPGCKGGPSTWGQPEALCPRWGQMCRSRAGVRGTYPCGGTEPEVELSREAGHYDSTCVY